MLQEVLSHEDDSVLLKAYIKEWTKYFTQCSYLPLPFQAMETAMAGSKPTKKANDGNRVNTVRTFSTFQTNIKMMLTDIHAYMYYVHTCIYVHVRAYY